jgi:hypothetical protein
VIALACTALLAANVWAISCIPAPSMQTCVSEWLSDEMAEGTATFCRPTPARMEWRKR